MKKTIVVTIGEYSDYSVMGLFTIEKPFDPEEVGLEYLKLHPEQAKEYQFDSRQFLNYLVQGGWLEQITPPEWGELHMPDYGCWGTGELSISDGWGFL